MDKNEFMRVAAALSPEERSALFGQATVRTSHEPWKWQHLADAVADGDVAKVVNACRAGLKHVNDNPARPEADGEALQMLAEVAPALAAAARESSHRRHKSYAFSVGGICVYLQSEAAAARRAESKRKVPIAAPAAAPAEQSKGGAR